jgi:hypothetical protein
MRRSGRRLRHGDPASARREGGVRDVGQKCAAYAERAAQRSARFSSGVGCDVGAGKHAPARGMAMRRLAAHACVYTHVPLRYSYSHMILVQLYTAVHVSTTTAAYEYAVARPEGPVPVNLYMYTHVFVREYSIRSHGGLRMRAY